MYTWHWKIIWNIISDQTELYDMDADISEFADIANNNKNRTSLLFKNLSRKLKASGAPLPYKKQAKK